MTDNESTTHRHCDRRIRGLWRRGSDRDAGTASGPRALRTGTFLFLVEGRAISILEDAMMVGIVHASASCTDGWSGIDLGIDERGGSVAAQEGKELKEDGVASQLRDDHDGLWVWNTFSLLLN